MKDIYTKNDVMKMLGQQPFVDYLEDASQDFEAVSAVHRELLLDGYDDLSFIAADYFVLGYIYGKRAERKKRKGR